MQHFNQIAPRVCTLVLFMFSCFNVTSRSCSLTGGAYFVDLSLFLSTFLQLYLLEETTHIRGAFPCFDQSKMIHIHVHTVHNVVHMSYPCIGLGVVVFSK